MPRVGNYHCHRILPPRQSPLPGRNSVNNSNWSNSIYTTIAITGWNGRVLRVVQVVMAGKNKVRPSPLPLPLPPPPLPLLNGQRGKAIEGVVLVALQVPLPLPPPAVRYHSVPLQLSLSIAPVGTLGVVVVMVVAAVMSRPWLW